MEILLHTIIFEPARWTPVRVSRFLPEILPPIAKAGIRKLEIYEHHLTMSPDEQALPGLLTSLGLEPVILSSYANLSPSGMTDEQFNQCACEMEARVHRYGFKKVRLFPGGRVSPTDEPGIEVVARRIGALASRMPEMEFLLESHDHSIADSPERFVKMVKDIAAPNVGILYQPTEFNTESAMRQLEIEMPYIRHLHLQNRGTGENQFARLAEGVIDLKRIVATLRANGIQCGATLEFVPSGICPMEAFDFDVVLEEAIAEMEVARTL